MLQMAVASLSLNPFSNLFYSQDSLTSCYCSLRCVFDLHALNCDGIRHSPSTLLNMIFK